MKSYFLLFLVLILTVFLFTSGSAQELKVADCMTFAKVSKETSSTSETVFIIEEGYTYQLDGSKDRYLKVIRNDELEGYIALGSISKSARYVIRSIVNEKIASDTVLQKNITESKIESKSKSKKSSSKWKSAPYPNPDDVQKHERGNYKSITYVYHCLKGKYVSVTYSTYGNNSWEKSTYESNGICY